MSGAISDAPMRVQVFNPTQSFLGYNQMLQAGAQVPLTQAQTQQAQAQAGLLGQQAIAANIQNQILGSSAPIQMEINRRSLAALHQSSQETEPMPWDPQPAQQPAAAGGAAQPVAPAIGQYATEAQPAPSAPGPVLPAQAGGGAPAAPVLAQAGGVPSAPAIGAAAPVAPAPPGGYVRQPSMSAPAAPQPVSNSGALTTGPMGIMLPGVGVPLPWQLAAGVLQAQDKAAEIQKAMAARVAAISQMINGIPIDPRTGQPDKTMWDQAVRNAWTQGLITSQQARNWYDHPNAQGNVNQSLISPEKQPGYMGQAAAATAAGTGAGGAPFELVKVPVTNADGSVSERTMTRQQALAGVGGPAGVAAAGGGAAGGGSAALSAMPPAKQAMVQEMAAATGMPVNILAAHIAHESGGSLQPAAGDGGKSYGVGQMQGPTLDAFNQQHGTHFTTQQIAADPALGTQLTAEHWLDLKARYNDNPVLASIAYQRGVGATDAWIKAGADPNALPPAVRQFIGQTYGPQGAAGGAAATPTGFGQGVPQLTPRQQAGVSLDTKQIEEDAKNVTDAQTGAMRAQSAMPVLYDARTKIPDVASGAFGTERAAIANFMQTFGPEWVNRFLAATTNINPAKAGDMQEFIKQTFQQVTSAESQMGGGVRVGALLTKYFSQAMPNINMQGPAIKDMMNFLLVGNQMARDYAQGAAAHYNTARAAFRQDPVGSPYTPLSDFDQQWTAPGALSSPAVYEAAANLLNGRPASVWAKGLSADQRAEAVRIVFRTDPGAKLLPTQRLAGQ